MEVLPFNTGMKLIEELKKEARDNGAYCLEISSKDLQDIMRVYHHRSIRHPTCCRALYNSMEENDISTNTTRKKFGSSFKVTFFL